MAVHHWDGGTLNRHLFIVHLSKVANLLIQQEPALPHGYAMDGCRGRHQYAGVYLLSAHSIVGIFP